MKPDLVMGAVNAPPRSRPIGRVEMVIQADILGGPQIAHDGIEEAPGPFRARTPVQISTLGEGETEGVNAHTS